MPTATQKHKIADLQILDCGLADYNQILQLQYKLRDQKYAGKTTNTFLIVEHPAVITFGARQSANKLKLNIEELAQKNIDIIQSRRGGGVTAHNPGQLILYPILNLQEKKLGIREYVRKLEETGIELLAELGVCSQSKKGYPGLWVGTKKNASIGVRVSKFVTCHGMAINIQNDLSIFDFITPCGLDGIKMTSVLKETGKQNSMSKVKEKLSQLIKKYFI